MSIPIDFFEEQAQLKPFFDGVDDFCKHRASTGSDLRNVLIRRLKIAIYQWPRRLAVLF